MQRFMHLPYYLTSVILTSKSVKVKMLILTCCENKQNMRCLMLLATHHRYVVKLIFLFQRKCYTIDFSQYKGFFLFLKRSFIYTFIHSYIHSKSIYPIYTRLSASHRGYKNGMASILKDQSHPRDTQLQYNLLCSSDES